MRQIWMWNLQWISLIMSKHGWRHKTWHALFSVDEYTGHSFRGIVVSGTEEASGSKESVYKSLCFCSNCMHQIKTWNGQILTWFVIYFFLSNTWLGENNCWNWIWCSYLDEEVVKENSLLAIDSTSWESRCCCSRRQKWIWSNDIECFTVHFFETLDYQSVW